ncbi:MAG: type II toxin-antitoxin system HipA family toxin [Acidipropionibacterium sp.]|jgi:serine/threonine-protein kinase HipA|nr:type II toxin-antitoxin system HipA family toxin [Acidipropionibacterium sp.]
MRAVDVLIDDGAKAARLVGRAYFARTHGEISTTFLYDSAYLADGGMNIDPSLMLVPGSQHQAGLLGAFADSAPDRWGRNLIEKAERVRAREERRTPRRLDDLDFLLGVSDDTRQGALRFRLQGHEEYLGAPSTVPRLISLPELLRASDDMASEGDSAQAVKRLLDTGTTGLGGARPKASVRLEDGGLAIAKFPHASDQWDVMAWEATALDLLDTASSRAPEHRLTHVGDRSVLILRRSDRATAGSRIGYISAMTVTASVDGQQRDYADIAEAMRDVSRSPRADHHELYGRVIASVILGNTDDHLRNHGFLSDHGSWTLSPAFDVNPTRTSPGPEPHRSWERTPFPTRWRASWRWQRTATDTVDEARNQMSGVASAMFRWREQARRNHISEREIVMMAESIEPRLEAVTRAGRA